MSYESWEDAILIIPEHMRAGVIRYIEDGVMMGGFTHAVFANDFLRACQTADWVNKSSLPSWGEFILYCPEGCHGSYSHVDNWVARKGLNGIVKEMENGTRV